MCAMHRSFVALVSTWFVVFCAIDARAECRFADSRAAATWTYRFRAESGPDGLVLHVTAQFPLGSNGAVSLQLPVHWAGETLHAMTNLRTSSACAQLEVSATGGSAVLRGRSNGLGTVTYDLRKDWAGPFVNPLQFHPVLMPEYVEFTGNNALVFPQFDTPAKKTARTTVQTGLRATPLVLDLGDEFRSRSLTSRSMPDRDRSSRRDRRGAVCGGRLPPSSVLDWTSASGPRRSRRVDVFR
jgi:hypothetical protein